MPAEKPYYHALPSALKPRHYDVSIYDISETSYKGTVAITLDVVLACRELHLHYRDLTIGAVSATIEGSPVQVTLGRFDPAKESFAVRFSMPLDCVGRQVCAVVHFTGKIQTNMAGFYKSAYQEDGVTKHMLSTQFEATDARRAFPCMDEPALKASFSVHITTAPNLTVLGNMPVQEVVSDGTLKTVSFEKTPVMSTYLLAWAIGEFEYVESFTKDLYNGKPLPVRIYTTKGYVQDAALALELAPKIVDYFSTVFELKYPLPKLDLIAVHAYSHNAMENWGLITYRSTALLFSEEKSDPSYKQKVAYVVAHEIAHQWFGNLVTMQWWDELWLNEGFATWVGFYAVDYLFPEWDIFAGFVSSSLQEALKLDGLRNSHPIKVPVVDALDIDQLFDAISYLKGASTILMLSTYLSTDVFLKGVAKYLKKNQFGNATSEDLWSAISDVSGKNVSAMMHTWISKIGFPVVEVEQNGSGLHLKQARFLNGGDATPEEDNAIWWIPLNPATENESLEVDHMDKKSLTISKTPAGAFKLNKGTDAPFRVNYSPEFFSKHILLHFPSFSTKDHVGIIADMASVAISGDKKTSTASFLQLAKLIAIDNDYLGSTYVTWLELTQRVSTFAIVFSGIDDEMATSVQKFCIRLYSGLATALVKKSVPKGEFLESKLKSHILNVASTLQIPELQTCARELFDEWKTSGKLDPSLRSFVFSSVVVDPKLSKEDFDAIMAEVKNPKSLDSREVALSALGHVENWQLAEKLLQNLLDESVIPTMDAHFLASSLSQNNSIRGLFWQFFKQNYTKLHKMMSSNMVVMERFVKMSLCNYASDEMEQDVRSFFAAKDVHGFDRALSQVLDQIKINAAWVDRDQEVVRQWLSANGF